MKEIKSPEFVRIPFSDIVGERYYLVERRRIYRTPAGEVDYIVKKSHLVFTDTSLPDWKTDNKVKFRVASNRDYKKIDPATNSIVNFSEFAEELYPDADSYDYYRLPDAHDENGNLLSDAWSDIEPIQPGLVSFQASLNVVDADMDDDHIWAFYEVPHVAVVGGKRRRTRRSVRRNRKSSRRYRR